MAQYFDHNFFFPLALLFLTSPNHDQHLHRPRHHPQQHWHVRPTRKHTRCRDLHLHLLIGIPVPIPMLLLLLTQLLTQMATRYNAGGEEEGMQRVLLGEMGEGG